MHVWVKRYRTWYCDRCAGQGQYVDGKVIAAPGVATGEYCPCDPKPTKVRITKYTGDIPGVANLTPGSIHDVIPPPENVFKENIWVMGEVHPILLLYHEYEEVDE